MVQGGCLCGNLRYEYTGEPKAKALCHCKDCQKISGSAFSVNALIPNDTFKTIAGSSKQYTKTADSGVPITNHFCPDCGSVCWRETDTFQGLKVVKVGTLDNKADLDALKPQLELFAPEKTSWVPAFEGTEDHEKM